MVSKAKQASQQDGATFLRDSFSDVQNVFMSLLNLSHKSITHNGVMGDVNEDRWIDVFREYFPHRYKINSGIIIDSKGQSSQQIDIVVYDQQYTPTLLTQKKHQFIPSEAVYAVFEVKPVINKEYLDYAGDKAASVRTLSRTSAPIHHAGGVYLPKEPINIVTGIVAREVDWADGLGNTFRTNLDRLVGDRRLDCGCVLTAGAFDTFDLDGGLTISDPDGALIFFLFRLLGKLQSLGTVPAIDWNAYVKVFES